MSKYADVLESIWTSKLHHTASEWARCGGRGRPSPGAHVAEEHHPHRVERVARPEERRLDVREGEQRGRGGVDVRGAQGGRVQGGMEAEHLLGGRDAVGPQAAGRAATHPEPKPGSGEYQ